MANLDVEPKKSSSILPWILGALALLLLLFFLFRGCNKTDNVVATTDSTTRTTDTSVAIAPATVDTGWGDVDFNAPAASYEEITDTSVNVRGNANYGIYGIGENVLFDEGKSTIRSSAEANLKQVAASISKRYNGGNVRIYGFTDSKGSAGLNKELAQKRAEAVRDWLVKNGNISSDRLSLHPIGEAEPAATNATPQGRQLNRRVEIVAKGVTTTK